MGFPAGLKTWAKGLRRDVLAVYYAARNPETPWPLRLLALFVAAYALSPIDLIPDFIPILGQVDDLLVVPLGLLIVLRNLPPEILASSRAKADAATARPRSYLAMAVILGLWLTPIVFVAYKVIRR